MSAAPRPQPAVQDPVKVDPKRYKVELELENDRVRVLRITDGPREKSVMHSHPDGIAVFLTRDSHFRMANPKRTASSRAKPCDFRPGAICPRIWPINR